MSENLGLVALARIQALEARPCAEAFRAKWLAGRTLDEAGAVDWLRRELGAECDHDHFGVHVDKEGNPAWRSGPAAGELGGLSSNRGIASDELAEASFGWVERYGWASWDALLFALADIQPVIAAVECSWRQSWGPFDGVAGPLNERIVLTCRPQATVADVTRAYQEAQRGIRLEAMAPRERTKPMTSSRRVDLAVMGGRVCLGEFESWAAAMSAYNAEHANNTENVDASYWAADQKGRFRRDVRDSFKQATGLDLDFQPDRRGLPPILSLEVQDGRVLDETYFRTRRNTWVPGGDDGD